MLIVIILLVVLYVFMYKRAHKDEKVIQIYNDNLDKLKDEYRVEMDTLNENIKKEGFEYKKFDYKDSNLKELVDLNDRNNLKSISMLINDNNEIVYKSSKNNIELCTNEEKAINFELQRNILQDKYGSVDVETIKDYYLQKLAGYKSSYIKNSLINLDSLKNKFLEDISDANDYRYWENYVNDLVTKKKSFLDQFFSEKYRSIHNIVNTYEAISNDINYYIENRINYLNDSYRIAKKGVDGELRVNNELEKYSEFINFKSKTFNLSSIDFIDGNYKVECDNILLTQHGIFVLETKNIGENSIGFNYQTGKEYSKYTLHIEKEGRWVKKFQDGSIEVMERNPVVQNRDHILKLKKILKYELDEDIDIKGIIVIANDNLEILNDSVSANICRVNSLYETITYYDKDKEMTESKIIKIKDIINKYNSNEHSADKFKIINVAKELVQLDKIINLNILRERKYIVDEAYKIIREYNSKMNILATKQQLDTIMDTKDLDKKHTSDLVKYQNGNTYLGQYFYDEYNGTRHLHGFGKYTWPNGNIYEGNFVIDKIQGEGKYTFANGDIYEGSLIRGQYNGKGKLVYNNGDIYEGDFINSKYHGKGKSISCRNIYEGDFIDGLANGVGKMLFANGDIYEGDFVNGKLDGKGKYTFANGNIYKGDFVNGKFNGQGKVKLSNENIYEGNFIDSRGIVVSPDGESYELSFEI